MNHSLSKYELIAVDIAVTIQWRYTYVTNYTPDAPWKSYLHDWVIYRVNVARYSSTMGHLGHVDIMICHTVQWLIVVDSCDHTT